MDRRNDTDEELGLAADVPTDAEVPVETTDAEVPVVTDLAGLFQYSGMVDALRDATKVLLRYPVSRATLIANGKKYNDLRNALITVLPGDTAQWTEEVDPETVTIDGLYMAAVALARWSDLVHQAPTFLLSQQVNAAQQQQVASAIAAGPEGLRALAGGAMQAAAGPHGVPTQPGKDEPRTGQYL